MKRLLVIACLLLAPPAALAQCPTCPRQSPAPVAQVRTYHGTQGVHVAYYRAPLRRFVYWRAQRGWPVARATVRVASWPVRFVFRGFRR